MSARVSFLFFILLLIVIRFCSAQQFSLNQGGTLLRDYHTIIPYEEVCGKLIVSVVIKDKSHRFMFDTGAPGTISQKLFEEIKPAPLARLPVKDQSGKLLNMAVVSVEEITLGDVSFYNVPALVATDARVFDCFNVDGFIGSNMLRNSIVQISSSDHTIIITDNKKKLKLTNKATSALYLTTLQSNPYFFVKLKGTSTAKEQVLFDSGMNGLLDLSLIHHQRFNAQHAFTVIAEGKGNNSFGLHGIAEDTIQYMVRISQVNIGRASFQNVSVQTTSDIHSRIGSELLRYGIVTLDYKNKKFYFDPFSPMVEMYKKQPSISGSYVDGKFVVGIVWNKRLKEMICTGDQIVSIDGINYEGISFCDLLQKPLPFKMKDTVKAIIKDKKGMIKEFVLERE